MKKPELLSEAKVMRYLSAIPDLQSLVVDLATSKTMLESVVENNEMLKRKLKSFKLTNHEAQERIRNLELSLDHLHQYGRRQNTEIAGIPNFIPQNALEDNVIDILRGIGVKVSSYKIVACHCLKCHGSMRNTIAIVKFTNRKVAM